MGLDCLVILYDFALNVTKKFECAKTVKVRMFQVGLKWLIPAAACTFFAI